MAWNSARGSADEDRPADLEVDHASVADFPLSDAQGEKAGRVVAFASPSISTATPHNAIATAGALLYVVCLFS